MNFSAVILAGGQSRRMGRDKAWLLVGGQPLLARQIELARSLGAREVFISGRADQDYSEFGCPVLQDRFAAAGPLAGIERALDQLSSPWLFVLAVDLPNLTPGILRQLTDHAAGTTGVIPRVSGRIEPLTAIYPKAASSLARTLLGNGFCAATTFAEQCVQFGMVTILDLPAAVARFFASCNTPSDLIPHQFSGLALAGAAAPPPPD